MNLEASLTHILEAGKYLHEEMHGRHDPYPCVACPGPLTVAKALDWLDAHPRDARTVRRIFHDARCASGCGSDSDHADRTQAPTATALRRFHRAIA